MQPILQIFFITPTKSSKYAIGGLDFNILQQDYKLAVFKLKASGFTSINKQYKQINKVWFITRWECKSGKPDVFI